MRIKPAPGLKIRDPITKMHIPDDGYDISETDLYWSRRLRDGDVVDMAAKTADSDKSSTNTPAISGGTK